MRQQSFEQKNKRTGKDPWGYFVPAGLFFMSAAHLKKKGGKSHSFAEEISNPLEESKKRRYNIKDYGMSVKGVEKWAAEGWEKC